MDVSWTLQYLVPAPAYGGAMEHGTQEEYEALRWEDDRAKPTWAELVAAWPAAQKTIVPLLERLGTLFESIPFNTVPVAVRAHFRLLQGGVRLALTAPVPDVDAAKYLIQTATLPGDTYTEGYTLPPELAGFQQALLAEF